MAELERASTFSLVKRLVSAYLRPYFGTLGLAVLFMVIGAAMASAFALLMEPVMDRVLVGGQTGLIVPLGVAIMLSFVINGAATYAHTVLMARVGLHVVADIQRDLFARFMDFDLAFFHKNHSGVLLSRIVNDVNVMRSAVSDSLTGMGKSLLTLIFLVGVMFYQDWKLALIACTVFPMAAAFVAWLGRRLRKISGNIQNEVADLSSLLSQTFQAMRQVKAFGMEAHESARAETAIMRLCRLAKKSIRVGTLSTPMNETLIGAALCGMIIYGGYQIVGGQTSVGSLMSFITAFSLAYEPIRKLAKLNNSLQIGLGAADRVFELMDQQPTILDPVSAQALGVALPDICFDHVSFAYDGADGPALEGVTFTAPAGKVTALVGPSGGGKSTIMNLIPRFYDVASGTVSVGGVDVRDAGMADLRAHIALVSQDITIFDDTVRANIGYGRAGANEDEIIAAARAAEADGFIRALPDGYDTRLGEHGVKLSGGQRQRIAIARAILRNAPILLLDEATSALDNESEQAIQRTLAALQAGRTTLVIAHRLSTVQQADCILVLDRGRVVESGRHDDLLARGGLYARMYQANLQMNE